jgi:hypothetical protein
LLICDGRPLEKKNHYFGPDADILADLLQPLLGDGIPVQGHTEKERLVMASGRSGIDQRSKEEEANKQSRNGTLVSHHQTTLSVLQGC